LHKYLCTDKQDQGIQKEAKLWDNFVQKRDIAMFPNLHDFLTCTDVNAKEQLDIIRQRLRQLAINFD